MRKLAIVGAAGVCLGWLLFCGPVFPTPDMCPQARPGCGGDCHGNEEVFSCPSTGEKPPCAAACHGESVDGSLGKTLVFPCPGSR